MTSNRRCTTSSGGATPFKVHINFDIPIFEDIIDCDVVYKWLNLLEGYFDIHNFFDRENITFSVKAIPHVKDWLETFYDKKTTNESTLFVVTPTWGSFRDSIKEQYYLVGSYGGLYTIWATLR